MKALSISKTIVILSLVLFPSMVLSLGYRNPSLEPRADGMASAVAVDTKSPSIIYFNPAGLSYLEGTVMAFGVDLIIPKYSHQNGTVITNTQSQLFAIPDFYIGYKPENQNFAFGLAINAPYGLGINWGADSFAQLDIVKASLNLINIQPTISFLFTKHLSVGVGVNFNVGTLDSRNKVDMGQVIGAGFLTGSLFDSRFKGKGFETTLNLGVIWKPIDTLTFGTSFKTGKNLVFEGDLNLTNLPITPPIFTSDSASYKAKTTLVIPPIVNWGIAYDVLSNLKVEFDVDWTKWSTFQNQTLNVTDNPLLSQTIARNWNDSMMYSIGSEWYAKDWLAIRFGYTYGEKSIPDATLEPSIPDTNRHVIAAGVGIKYKKYLINLAYNAVISQANSASNSILFPYANLNGTYDAFTNIVALGLEYKF